MDRTQTSHNTRHTNTSPKQPTTTTTTTNHRLSKDSIVHAIFQSLFGKRKIRSGPRERYGGNWDDVDEDDDDDDDTDVDGGYGGAHKRPDEEEEVDESWIKTGISLSLFSSKAVDFACRFGKSKTRTFFVINIVV